MRLRMPFCDWLARKVLRGQRQKQKIKISGINENTAPRPRFLFYFLFSVAISGIIILAQGLIALPLQAGYVTVDENKLIPDGYQISGKNNVTVKNPDGSYTARFFQSEKFYKDKEEKWQSIESMVRVRDLGGGEIGFLINGKMFSLQPAYQIKDRVSLREQLPPVYQRADMIKVFSEPVPFGHKWSHSMYRLPEVEAVEFWFTSSDHSVVQNDDHKIIIDNLLRLDFSDLVNSGYQVDLSTERVRITNLQNGWNVLDPSPYASTAAADGQITSLGIAASNGTTSAIDLNNVAGEVYIKSYLSFDTSDLPDGATVTASDVNTYADSYTKSKTEDTIYSVQYYTQSDCIGAALDSGDYSCGNSDSGSLDWANTTGNKSKTLTTPDARINKTGDTDFRLQPGWTVAAGNYKGAVMRQTEYTGTTTDPYLDVTYISGSTISGVAYTDEGSTTLDGSSTNKTVNLRVEGLGSYTTEITTSDGAWSISSVTVNDGEVVTVYLDEEDEEATTVYVSDGTGQSNVDLYQNTLILRSDSGSITNAHLATADDTDDDIKYVVSSGNLTVDSGFELHIESGTYDPGGTVTTQSADLHVDDNATAYLDTATNTIGGDIQVGDNATLHIDTDTNVVGGDITMDTGSYTVDYSTGTPTVTMQATGVIDDVSGLGPDFYNLTIDGTAITTTISADVDVYNTLDVDIDDNLSISSSVTHRGSTLTLDGTISGSGHFTYWSSTVFPDTGTISADLWIYVNPSGSILSDRTYGGDVYIYANSGGSYSVTMEAGTYNISSNLIVITSSTYDVTLTGAANDPTVNISGNLSYTKGFTGTPIIATGAGIWTVSGDVGLTDGTFTAEAGNTLKMNGTAKSITADSNTLQNFEVSGGSITSIDALDVNNTFTVSSGSFTQGDDVDLNVADDFTLDSGVTFDDADGTGSLIFDGDLTLSDDTLPQQDLGNVEIGTSPDTIELDSDVTASGLIVNSGDILNTNGYDLTIGSNGVQVTGTIDCTDDVETDETYINTAGKFELQSGAVFTQDQSVVTFDATSGTHDLIADGSFNLYDMILDDGGGGSLQVDVEDNVTVDNDLTITDGTLNIQSGMTLTHDGATLTLNDIITGAGRLTYTSSTNFPTTGTISSILRYDVTDNAQNMTNRTYGGNVEVYNNSASTRTVTGLAGTITINADLESSTDDAAVTLDLDTNDPIVDISGDVTIGTTTTLSASASASFTIGGSWANSGIFTDNSGTVIFDSDDAGETLSGTLNGSSDFNKIKFDDVSGSDATWTIQDAMLVSAANAADTFIIGDGTVTLGDSDGDDLDVRGKWTIGDLGEAGTFQTIALAQGSEIIIDMNANASAPACANCQILIGDSSGSEASFKLAANTVLRLNPGALSASDTNIYVDDTGFFEVMGSLDESGLTATATDTAMLMETKLCANHDYSADEHTNKAIRMSSGLAISYMYNITATNQTDSDCATDFYDSLSRADNSSASTTVSSVSVLGPERYVCSGANNLISATKEGAGRFLHNLTENEYYLITYSTNNDAGCSSNDSFYISNYPDVYTNLTATDSIEISDGVRAGDAFEVIDYAHITAENGTTCDAAVGSTSESYINSSANSNTVIQYAEICNLGNNDVSDQWSIYVGNLDGDDANEGFLIDRTNYHHCYGGPRLDWPDDISQANGMGLTNNYFHDTTNRGILTGTSDNVYVAYNRIKSLASNTFDIGSTSTNYSMVGNHLALCGAACMRNLGDNNTFSSNWTESSAGYDYCIRLNAGATGNIIDSNNIMGCYYAGIYNAAANNTITNNTIHYNRDDGIYLDTTAQNNIVDGNTIHYSINEEGIDNRGTHNLISNNVIYNDDGENGILNRTSTKNIYQSNTIYSNGGDYGMMFDGSAIAGIRSIDNDIYSEQYGYIFNTSVAATDQYLVGNRFGTSGINTGADFYYVTAYAHEGHFYDNAFDSGDDVQGAISTAGAYLISYKHGNSDGATSIWGEYASVADNAETPQDESTEKYNYADNSWEDSVTPHGYAGTGTEDSDLEFAFNGGSMGGTSDEYVYRAYYNGATWDIFRNGSELAGDASNGVQYEDDDDDGGTAPGVQFTITQGGTSYVAGDTYTFVAFRNSGDANTQKTITFEQDGDTYTNSSGTTIELTGQSADTNVTQLTRVAGNYGFTVGGTIDAQYYAFDYTNASGLNIASTATVTELSDGSFDNIAAGGSYITVADITSVDDFYNNVFDDNGDGTDSNVTYNVNADGANIAWTFWDYSGNKAGEAYDNEANSAYVGWGEELTLSLSSNTIDLGTINTSATSNDNHTLTVTSTADSGYTCSVVEDGDLRDGFGNTINDVSDGTVTAGEEEYGLSCSGGDCQLLGDIAMSGSPLTVASNAGEVTGEATTMTYTGAVDADTPGSNYSQDVTYTCTANF
ncbi:MAG: right-handed parallel beta-helix repeat-containing protein [Patescibacteria group bacterium]